MGAADDLTGLLTQLTKADTDIGYRSGIVTAWNAETGENTITIAGAPIVNTPFLIRAEALAIRVGDVVGLLRVRSQYFVLGRISVNAGEIVVRDSDGDDSVGIGRTEAGGGQITTYYPNGVTHARIGQLTIEATGEEVGQGFLLQRDDGIDILGAGPLTPGGPAVIRARDPNGDLAFFTRDSGGWALFGSDGGIVAAPDETHGDLLDRPHIDVPMYGQNSTGDLRYPGTSFQIIWEGRLRYTHPGLYVQARTWVSSSDATMPTGELRLTVNGTQVGSTVIVTATSGVYVDFGAVTHDLSSLGLTPYGGYRVAIEARISANSGTGRYVSVIPYGVTKRGL